MNERVGVVPPGSTAMAEDYEISFRKLSTDGTGKTDLVASPGGKAYGVVFELTPEEFERVGRFEGGYHEADVPVLVGARDVTAKTFFADAARVRSGLLPARAYLEHLLIGAREHQLPADYISMLEGVEVADKEMLQEIFRKTVFGFIQSDIEREIWLARKTEHERLHGSYPGPHPGGGNFLVALGLLCYTEFLGAFKTRRRGTDESDKPRTAQGQENFLAFYRLMGEPYRQFERQIAPARVYNVFRNGFAHEYSAKGNCTVVMPGLAECGLRKQGDEYELVVETYFADFMKAAETLYQELMENPRLPT